MPPADSTIPADWFRQGDLDLCAARILLENDGPFPVIAFHLHQTIEKYLKGYLLSTGWPLRRIHDLETLVQEAIERDPDFVPFLERCQEIAEFYIETRYPIGVESAIPGSALMEYHDIAAQMAALIRAKTGS